MDNDITPTIEQDVKHQLAKLVLGTVAGFAAGKLVEVVYDSMLNARRSTPTPEQ